MKKHAKITRDKRSQRVLKHLIIFISSTLLLLANPPQPCTLDLAPNTAEIFCEDETLNLLLEYDQGSNAKGKLTKITDSSGSLVFTYDAKGNLATKTQEIDGKTFTTAYTYNEQDKLTTQTYPSGKELSYAYNAQGELNSLSIDGTPFITDIQTNQNGLLSYTYADDTTHTREYDTNGRVTKLIYPNYTETVNYNEVSNITSITANSKTKSFEYDAVDRLISYDSNATDYQRFTYDANGNRLTQNQETNKTRRFTYLDNTNTLEGIKYYHTLDENTTNVTKDINYTYDETGNIIQDDKHTYTYDSRNRLVAVDNNVTYQYNYDNRRVSKTVNGTTTYYIYEAHKLVGEYQADSTVIKEYIYYNDTPIATSTQTETHKIYADHLDTPKRVADSTNNIIWEWESKPFGEDKPTGSYTLNLRFPGQYYDQETGTHYNINRDYNPITGRYIQSDPIGFGGGVNTYLYPNGNSLRFVDEEGLNPVSVAIAVLGAATKACSKNKVCECTAMYAAYKSVCAFGGCKGTDSCATNTFKTYAALMCSTWRHAYVKMDCDKHIPTTKDHPKAAQQALNKWTTCVSLKPICCGSFW